MPILGMIENAAAGGILGMMNDRRQVRQDQRLKANQMQYDKAMTDYNMKKQLEMWEATGYEAQGKQLDKAGMNRALMYGMGGGGGQTANVSTAHGGQAQAPSGGGEIMGMTTQLALVQAQRENIEANTAKTITETKKIGGVDTANVEAHTKSLIQGVSNQKAQEQLTKAETNLKQMEGVVQGGTMEARMDFIEYQTEQAVINIGLARQQEYFNRQSMEDRLTIVRKQAIQAGLLNGLTTAQTAQTQAQTGNTNADTQLKGVQAQKMLNDAMINNAELKLKIEQVAQGWTNLEQGNKKLQLEGIMNMVESIYKGESNLGMTMQYHDKQKVLEELEKILNRTVSALPKGAGEIDPKKLVTGGMKF